MSDDKPKWGTPEHGNGAAPSEAGDLAKEYGISPDRAQMLIDRFGHDPAELAKAVSALKARQRPS